MDTVQVMYVGTKPMKEDNVAGTGVVWTGEGDVRSVPLSAWPTLAKHSGVWRLADGVTHDKVLAEVAVKVKAPAVPEQSARGGGAEKPGGAPGDGEAIYGSDHPPYIDIDGAEVQLGIVVAAAHTASELTVAEWNALPDADRHDFVEAEIERLRNVAADAKVKAAANAAQTMTKPLTHAELKAKLTKLKIPFRGNAKTAELQALLDAKKAEG